jgi:hypothetical protein
MTIRVLDSLVGHDEGGDFGYGKGIHKDVPESRAKRLIKDGLAVIAEVLIEAATDAIVKKATKR